MTQPNNQLIHLLPRKARAQLLSHCELVELALSEVLCGPGELCRHAYFPTESFNSLLTSMGGKLVLEVGMTGFEGMLGSQLSLGVPLSPLHAVVQGAGLTWRMSANAFCAEIAHNPHCRASSLLGLFADPHRSVKMADAKWRKSSSVPPRASPMRSKPLRATTRKGVGSRPVAALGCMRDMSSSARRP